MYQIRYVAKDKLQPGVFGFCSHKRKEILIREDLPNCVKKCLLAHEQQHEKDFERIQGVKNILWLEIKANIVSMFKHPIGFIVCLLMSIFSIERWKLYIRRIIEKK